jgi:ubiquinone/menaquinone biosynthesis C-methylase UbiE/DNA-binding MarR family transcriptional regulator
VGAEALQRILKTLADPTRVRILALLEREELAVQELMDVLGMAQSRVSRHLAILREAGLVQDRRDGTFVFYRAAPLDQGAWRDAWALVRASLARDSTHERDAAALGRVIGERAARTRRFFDSVGPEWDALRKVFHDDLLRARAVTRLVDPGLVVADIGTGTGVLALELARLGLRVIAIDHSPRMLEAARAKARAEGLAGIDLRQGDARALPLENGEVDAALAHMVVQYLASPAEALREMARAVRPGGAVVVVDFLHHDHEWMRQELGVTWLGFTQGEIAAWFADAGLGELRIETEAAAAGGRDLPATFIASARRPR